MNWELNSNAQITGGGSVCESTSISIETWAPAPPAGSYFIVTLQHYDDQWNNVAVFTTSPSSGPGTMSLDFYNKLFFLDILNPSGGNVPFPGYGWQTYRIKVELFNGSTGKVSSNSPKYTNPFQIHLKQSDPVTQGALFVDGRVGIEQRTGAEVVSNCDDPNDYTVDISRNHDNYYIPLYEIYTSNGNGAPLNMLTSQSFSLGGPNPPTFSQMLYALNQDFRSYFSYQNSSYFLIRLDIRDDCSLNPAQEIEMLYKVNEAPNILDFELIYEDPNNSGSGNYYPWDLTVAQPPSSDQANPVDLGSATGGLYISTASTNYDSYTLDVYKAPIGLPPIPVGTETGQPSPFPAYHRLGNPQMYTNPADNPAANIGDTYLATVTLSTQGCNTLTRSSYFRMPQSLQYYKYGGNENTNNWHDFNPEGQSLTVHLDKEATAGEDLRLRMYSLDGRLLHEDANWHSGTHTTPGLDLPNGVYLLHVINEQGHTQYREKVSFY